MLLLFSDHPGYDNHINSMFGEDEATPNYKKFFNFIKSTKCERTNVAPLKREGFLHIQQLF
jgi:hypothetical protein